MAQKVAGIHYSMTADSAKLIRELEKSRKATQRFANDARRGMNRAQYAFNRLRRAAQVFASAFIVVGTIRSIGRMAAAIEKAEDKMTLLSARFNQFGRSTGTFRSVYDLSQKLGTSLEETGSGMTRLLISTKALGTTTNTLLKVQENIVLLGRAGGTSTEELVGGMRQLTQGLASGRLQGEELRSVLENIPLVAMEIADELEIDIGQIRQFAADGKITGDVIVRALEEIKIKAEDLPETFAISSQKVRTEWELTLAALGRSVPVTALFREMQELLKWFREEQLKDFSLFSEAETVNRIEVVEARLEVLRENLAKAEASGLVAASNAPIFRDLEETNEELDGLYARLKVIIAERDRIVKLDGAAGVAAAIAGDDEALKAFNKELKSVADRFATAEQKAEVLRQTWVKFRNELTPGQIANIAREINETLEGGLEEIPLRAKRTLESFKETTEEMSQYGKQAARNIQSAFADFLFDPLEEGLDGLLKSFVNVIRRILAEMLASQILNSSVGTAIGSFFGGPKAMGGPVLAGTPYLVGEQGPELFMPSSSGMIVPNNKLGGGNVSVNYAIDARGADEAAVIARMIPLLERTKDITKNEVRRDMREGRFT